MQVIYTTCPDTAVAEALCQGLLEERLIACANVMDNVTSFYQWEEGIRQDSEVVVLFKTGDENVQAVINYVETHHPYECPCIWSQKPETCFAMFAEWVRKETTS